MHSPRVWGWTVKRRAWGALRTAFPTRVGVDLRAAVMLLPTEAAFPTRVGVDL